METKTTKQAVSNELIENNNLHTCFIDSLRLATRNDNMILLQLFSTMPSGSIEQSRSMMTSAFAKKLIDALALRADYYPTKAEETGD